jgi:hypothetical protein
LDTGAEAILLRCSTAADRSCEMEFMEETLIIFGNGGKTTSNTKAHIQVNWKQ